MKAYLSEIFSSIQGEGPYVGERHLFLRFCGCHRTCRYCDTGTGRTAEARVDRDAPAGACGPEPNPVPAARVLELVRELDRGKANRRIALTGGEPLLQAPSLRALLPLLCEDGHSLYLETAGDLPAPLRAVIEWIDVVAMDVKLSSVTGEGNTFPEHWRFLRTCRDVGVEAFVKLVLSAGTDGGELLEAARGIRESGGAGSLVVLQPLTPSGRNRAAPSPAQLLRWQEAVAALLPNVRVIPQVHLLMGMP